MTVPAAVEVLPHGADRDAWLEVRRTGIGASDISALVGLNKRRGPLHVWSDKLMPDDEPPNEAMEWGNRLEPVVREEFAQRAAVTVQPAGTYRNRALPWMLANPDGLCGDGAGLEIKVVGGWAAVEWRGDAMPDHAALQSQWGMAVTGLDVWHVAALLGGTQLVYRTARRNPSLIDYLTEYAARFWREHVETGEPPPAAIAPHGEAWLDARYRNPDEATAEIAAADWRELAREYRRTQDAVAVATADHERARAAIKERMGAAEALALPEQFGAVELATWKANGTLRAKALRADHPDEYAECLEQRPAFAAWKLAELYPDLYDQYRARVLRVRGTRDEEL